MEKESRFPGSLPKLPKSQFPARSESTEVYPRPGVVVTLVQRVFYIYIYISIAEEGQAMENLGKSRMHTLRTYLTWRCPPCPPYSVLCMYGVCMHAFRASVKWRFRCESGAAELVQTLVCSEEMTINPVDQNTSAQIAECLTLLH